MHQAAAGWAHLHNNDQPFMKRRQTLELDKVLCRTLSLTPSQLSVEIDLVEVMSILYFLMAFWDLANCSLRFPYDKNSEGHTLDKTHDIIIRVCYACPGIRNKASQGLELSTHCLLGCPQHAKVRKCVDLAGTLWFYIVCYSHIEQCTTLWQINKWK